MVFTRSRFATLLLALTLGVAASVAVSACAGSGDDSDSSQVAPTPEETLTESALAMAEATSMAFTLEQEGASVPIDDSGNLNFQAAVGRIVEPSSADALLTVDALGFTTEIGAIAIDGEIWFTNPLTGNWTEAPASFTFDPAALLDPERGIPALLTEAAPAARALDQSGTAADGDDAPTDATDGVDRSGWDGFTAVASGQRVDILTGGLLGDETAVEVWIDRDSGRVAEISFEIPVADDLSRWQMLITDYDIEADIAPPDLGGS